MGDGPGHALLSRSEDLRVPFLGWSLNQLMADSMRSARRGTLIPANLPWPAAVKQMTAVTSGSAGWVYLSWAYLPPRVLFLVSLGLVGPQSVSWE